MEQCRPAAAAVAGFTKRLSANACSTLAARIANPSRTGAQGRSHAVFALVSQATSSTLWHRTFGGASQSGPAVRRLSPRRSNSPFHSGRPPSRQGAAGKTLLSTAYERAGHAASGAIRRSRLPTLVAHGAGSRGALAGTGTERTAAGMVVVQRG